MSTVYKRTFETAQSSGALAWSMRSSITNPDGDLNFSVGSGSTQKIIVGFRSDGTLVAYDDDTTSDIVLVAAFIASRNYRVEVEWDDAAHPDQFRARVDFGTWTAWLGVVGTYSTMDAVFMEDAATVPGDFWVDAFNSPGGTSGIIGGRWILGARIYLNSATQYLSDDYVRTDDTVYEGRIINWGYIERSIASPSGPPRVGDCQLRIADTDQKWRTLLAAQTGIRRLIEIFRVTDGAILGGFEIAPGGIQFGPGYIEIRGVDITQKWMDRPIPSLGTRANFTWMLGTVPEFFFPIIFGMKFSFAVVPSQGTIRCPHMGPTTKVTGSVAVDRYAVSRFANFESTGLPTAVYRKLAGETSFTAVLTSEYVLTIDEDITIDGVTYTPTYLDFLADQDLDAEIRIETCGAASSVAIGGLPAFTPTTDDIPRNPIDFLTLLMLPIAQSIGGDTRIERYNTESLIAVRDLFATYPDSFKCDVAITEPITFANVIARWCSNFQVDWFVNRHFQYEVAKTFSENYTRPVLTDLRDFISVTPELAPQTFNQMLVRYEYNAATKTFDDTFLLNLAADQAELGDVEYQGNTPQVEFQTFDAHYTVDVVTAVSGAAQANAYQRLGSHRVTIEVPTPEWFETLELAGQIGVTHYGGIGGAWANKEFKILSLRHDLSRLRTTADMVLRLPVEY